MFIRLLFITFRLIIIACGLSPLTAAAASCSVVEYLREKSALSDMVVNPCLSENTAGVGTVFQMHPGGRLWLKSLSTNDPSLNYQLICRNKSRKPTKVSVTSFLLPWIQTSGFVSCNSWVENKMECKNSNGDPDVLFCAFAAMKKPEINQDIQRTTSLSMRGVPGEDASNASARALSVQADQVTDLMKPEIDLCRNVYQNQQNLRVEWVVKTTGKINQPTIKEPVPDEGFSACVLDVIKNFSYPSLPYDLQLSHQF